MGIRDWFRKAGPPAPAPASRRFHDDRSRMFDLAGTHRLAQLFAVPRGERDAGWNAQMLDTAWTASVQLTEPQTFIGPDGFPYLRLDVPRPESSFSSQCLADVAGGCLTNLVGAALFAGPDDPPEAAQYVFSLGLIDSLVRYDSPDGDPIDVAESALPPDTDGAFSVTEQGLGQTMTVTKEHQALVGTPSAAYLPPHLARSLHHFLTRGWGVADPRVSLIADTHMRPHRSLVISCKRSDFAPDADVDAIVRQLLWHLDPGRMVMLMPEHWTPDEMTPLTQLFEAR
jgi:hypothetical protein